LLAPFPNPVRVGPGALTLTLVLPSTSTMEAVVYDVLGREVARLAPGSFGAGRQELTFDVASLPTGTYVVRVEAVASDGRGTLRAQRQVTVAR
jgi:hypothetical protein